MKTCTEDGCTRAHVARGLCAMHWKRKYGGNKLREYQCTVCGKIVFKYGDSRRRFVCSYDCRWFLQFAGASCPVPASHPSRQTPKEPRPDWVGQSCRVFVRDCAVCGAAFTSQYTRVTCSPGCAEVKRLADKREHRHRRRARERGARTAPVVRYRIYERDRWRCYICRKKVRRSAIAPHPLAPTLDHVIPLSQGGAHEPANVRTAHFICNSRRGDRGGGEQLMLIG